MTAFRATDRWLTSSRPRPRARVRLICFPYAGGGASVFRGWGDGLPESVEVCPVQLPGRETRFREAPFTLLQALIGALAEGLRPYLDRPFAFFGHSLGALVAFELARRLARDGGPQPARLVVSGCGAPHVLTREEPVHTLPDAEFRHKLRGLNGTPAAVLENNELMELLLPTLRADFALCETYRYTPGPALTCPVSAWGGLGDEAVSPQGLGAWREHTTGSVRLRLFPGDHFFLHSARPLLLRCLAHELLEVVSEPSAPEFVWETAAPLRTNQDGAVDTLWSSPASSGWECVVSAASGSAGGGDPPCYQSGPGPRKVAAGPRRGIPTCRQPPRLASGRAAGAQAVASEGVAAVPT